MMNRILLLLAFSCSVGLGPHGDPQQPVCSSGTCSNGKCSTSGISSFPSITAFSNVPGTIVGGGAYSTTAGYSSASAYSQPVNYQSTYSQPVETQTSYVQSEYIPSAQPVQSTSYAQSTPVYSQQVISQPTYSQPVYSQPVYTQPVQSYQTYSPPVYSQPTYSQPVNSQQYYSPPVYSNQVVSNSCNNVVYSQPVNMAPVNVAPVSSYSSCCPTQSVPAYTTTAMPATRVYSSQGNVVYSQGNIAQANGTYANYSSASSQTYTPAYTQTRAISGNATSMRSGSGLAQRKAQQAASSRIRGHIGGGLGGARYEGVGWSNQSAQNAIQACCYWGQRQPVDIGVAQSSDGWWYACVLYN